MDNKNTKGLIKIVKDAQEVPNAYEFYLNGMVDLGWMLRGTKLPTQNQLHTIYMIKDIMRVLEKHWEPFDRTIVESWYPNK
jgi:hypothetical protein